MIPAKRKDLDNGHVALLNLCDRKLKDGTFGGLMAATIYLAEARKIRKLIEKG